MDRVLECRHVTRDEARPERRRARNRRNRHAAKSFRSDGNESPAGIIRIREKYGDAIEAERLADAAHQTLAQPSQIELAAQLTREVQLLVKDGRELAAQMNRLSAEAQGAAGAVREDTLPRVNALAESVDRSAQQVGRLALQLDREPQSAIFGRRPRRPGPGEPGFQ